MPDNIRRDEKGGKALNFVYLTFSRKPRPVRCYSDLSERVTYGAALASGSCLRPLAQLLVLTRAPLHTFRLW